MHCQLCDVYHQEGQENACSHFLSNPHLLSDTKSNQPWRCHTLSLRLPFCSILPKRDIQRLSTSCWLLPLWVRSAPPADWPSSIPPNSFQLPSPTLWPHGLQQARLEYSKPAEPGDLPAISPSSLLTYLVLSEKLRPQKPSLTHHWVQLERNFC